jgi:Cu2+-exporting ATPase
MAKALDSNTFDETVLAVSNMHCGGCVRGIEQALGATQGITEARANLTTKRVRVRFDPSAIDVPGVVNALANAGFAAARFDGGLAAADGDQRFLLRCMTVAGVAALPIMLMMVAGLLGLTASLSAATHQTLHWIAAAIALPAVAYAGRPFFHSAWTAVRAWRVNMDVPISLAVLLATGLSLWQVWTGAPEVYFDAAVSLLFFLLIGRYLDARVRGKAREAAGDLLAFAASEATLIDAETGAHRRVQTAEIGTGNRVLVASGEKVPVDGLIVDGTTQFDTSLITGESIPRAFDVGETVYAGCINLGPAVEMQAIAMADDSLLADIARLMEDAQQTRDRFVRLADKAAKVYAPLVHGLGALTFIGWMIAGAGIEQALITAIAVLIITCPCALGLAVPAVQVVAAGRLFKRGVLVKNGAALERFAEIDRVVFDKTGTLTLGTPSVTNAAQYRDDDLRVAASIAAVSRHPLSRAIVAAAEARLENIVAARSAVETAGAGVEADGARLGSATWCGLDDNTADGENGTVVWLTRPDGPPLAFHFDDALRPDAKAVIAELHRLGLPVSLLSGDRPDAVEAVATELGIEHAESGLSPKDKIERLEAWKAQGERVLMVGDGLNDAPALAAAHASLSPATAADISQTAADMVFQGESLGALPEALLVARAARRHVLQNFGLAALYNAISVPLAVAGLVTPLLAAAAMSTSSILVTANALRLRALPRPWKG